MQFSLLSGGSTIRLRAFEPSSAPHPALLLLHGAGGNVDFWLDRLSPAAAALGVAVYAVHYFDRTGTDRAHPALLADGRHVPLWLETIADVIDSIAARPGVDATRIALVGISLGAFLALAHATQHRAHRARIRAIVEISGGLVPPYEVAATSTFPPTLILHGEQDNVVPVSQAHALNATLDRLAVRHQVCLLPGEGHWFSPAAQGCILSVVGAFLQQHL